MGSFQQVIMGATCLVAAFFFGSYLHNRPATNETAGEGQVASADPLESIFAFGKAKSNDQLPGPDASPVALSATSTAAPVVANRPDSPQVNSAIDASERIPQQLAVKKQEQHASMPARPGDEHAKSLQKPVVPDFSEMRSRFDDTPLELPGEGVQSESVSAIHESERIRGGFNTFEDAPEVVIRKPQKLTSLEEFSNALDRLERESDSAETDRELASGQNADRWRVNRSEKIDRFRSKGMAPEPDSQPRKTIDDVIAERSANYLLKSDEDTSTFATDPVQDDWVSNQRQEITRQAANRGRDILDIDDPGKRFHSVLTSPESGAVPSSFGRPEQDYETDYYAPAKPSPAPVVSQGQMRRIPRQNSNWQSRSNIQSEFRSNTYRIQPGDTLQSISVRFFGVPDHYLDIYKANREALDQITSSPQGVVIRIPKLNN